MYMMYNVQCTYLSGDLEFLLVNLREAHSHLAQLSIQLQVGTTLRRQQLLSRSEGQTTATALHVYSVYTHTCTTCVLHVYNYTNTCILCTHVLVLLILCTCNCTTCVLHVVSTTTG